MAQTQIPKVIQMVEETPFFVKRRTVKEARPVRFRALKVGDTYIVAYVYDDAVYHAVVTPTYTVKSYDNWAEAFETLLVAVKGAAGQRIEIVEVEATRYVFDVEEVDRDNPSRVSNYEEVAVEWGDRYAIDEDIYTEWP